MVEVSKIQRALNDLGLDGWLLFDFRGSNALARRILEIDGRCLSTRRFFYLIPAKGSPLKLVHHIEPRSLDHLPGENLVYHRWQELDDRLAEMLDGLAKVAMEYSPRNAIPTISRVDAGTIEMVRACGVDVVSSGDLIQLFEATWDSEQWAMHLEAERGTTSAFDVAWRLIAERTRAGAGITEVEVQAAIVDHFHRNGLTSDHPPCVAVGAHSGDPHYEPGPVTDTPIVPNDLVLIDLWAKVDRPRAVYSDLTRIGFVGDVVPDVYKDLFQIVTTARDAAINLVRKSFQSASPLRGWQVDEAARGVIEQAGYGSHFVHRTGHSIGQETHGNGANMDNFETHEERLIMPRTCFSIEPGIYLSDYGVRSEVNVFVDDQGHVHVTGNPQREIQPILRDY